MADHAKTVVLTGTSEFLPAQLMGSLEEDARYGQILAADVREPIHQGEKTIHCPVDLTVPEAGAELTRYFRDHNAKILVHAAFLSHPLHDNNYAHELQVIGTMHVLNAAAAAGLEKVILLGTTMSYGARPDNANFLSESDPLKGGKDCPQVGDLVEAEKQFNRFAESHPETVTCILRMGCLLGAHVDGFIPRLMARRAVPVIMGYDPLMQFLHESDALTALKLAVDQDFRGTYNIVADGVQPWSTTLAMGGRVPMPIPHVLLDQLGSLLWTLQALDAPPSLLNYLRYLWVADGARARSEMGFYPQYSTVDAVRAFFGSAGVERSTS